MAARIAHEVRNPLVSIGAAAQVVAEELRRRRARSPARCGAIAREVKRLDAIVTDFLKLRAAAARRARASSIWPRSSTRRSALVRAKAPEQRARASTSSGRWRRAAIPTRIKQVLLNVLLNAVEAAPRSARSTATAQTRRRAASMLVGRRSRAGRPRSARRRVFDPFFSTKTRGTGLGLAVSKQIVDEHHGRIRLFNRRGGGTRVVIELPVG